jgi:hypothetical protein
MGDPILVLDIPEDEIAKYGWVDTLAEWCIPAELANRYGPPRVLYDPVDDWTSCPDWWTDQPLGESPRDTPADDTPADGL